MDPLSITASVVAIVQITGQCLKLVKIGPSKHQLTRLKEVNATLYGFNGIVRNLQTHLEIYKDDQARLSALDRLKEPLDRCGEALRLLKTRLEHDGFWSQYVTGMRFDKKLEDCLRVVSDATSLLELALQSDQRVLINAVESYVRNIARETRDIQAAITINEQLLVEVGSQVKQSSELTIRLHQEQSHNVAAVRDAVENLTSGIEAQKQYTHRSDVLVWLSSVDVRSNYMDVLRAREPGTGQWLMSHDLFCSWEGGSPEALWLQGLPGAGKTFLSATVIDNLERSAAAPVAYFFFDFKDAEKQTTLAMLRSVAAQLESELPSPYLSHALEDLYSRCCTAGQRRGPTPDDAINLLKSYSIETVRPYIILDALDECKDRGKLIDALQLLRKSAPNLRFFSTSRREADLVDALTDDMFYGLPIEGDALKDDITIYINSTLRDDQHLRKLSEELKSHIQRTLVEGSRFMQIDAIRPLKRPKAIKEALTKLPKTLDETYERIILQLCEKNPDENAPLLKRIFMFTAFSRRPMVLAELAQAVIIEVDGNSYDEDAAFHDPAALLELCQPLVAPSQSTGLVGFVHYSVQEYLLSDRLSKAGGQIGELAIDPKTAHTEIARVCLSFLNHDDFSSGACTSYDEFKERAAQFPFLSYAASEWLYHIKKLDVQIELKSAILNLLVPQKNPKLANMLQNFPQSHCGRGDDLIFFLRVKMGNPGKEMGNPGKETVVPFKYAMNSLALAARWKLYDVLWDIVQSGADINLPGSSNGNALQTAVYHGDLAAVKILRDLGADINHVGDGTFYHSPLITAVLRGHQDIINVLLCMGADVHDQGGIHGGALHAAASCDDVSAMRRLVEAGVDVDCAGGEDWRRTPLSQAVMGGNIEAALYLLGLGASTGGYSIVGLANGLARAHRPGRVTVDSIERVVQGLADLGHHVGVQLPDQDRAEEEALAEEDVPLKENRRFGLLRLEGDCSMPFHFVSKSRATPLQDLRRFL